MSDLACAWCEGYGGDGDWVMLTNLNTLEEKQFCGAGCLIHWLFTQTPYYFQELQVD